MTVYCSKCGIPIEEEEPKKYFCPMCNKYTDFIKLEAKSGEDKEKKPEEPPIPS